MSKTAYIISTIHRRKLVLLNLPHFPHISHHLWRIYVWKVPIVLPREFEYRQMRVVAFELAEASVSRSARVLKLFSREKAIENLRLFDYVSRFTTVRRLSLHNSSLFREMSDRRKAWLLCVSTFRIRVTAKVCLACLPRLARRQRILWPLSSATADFFKYFSCLFYPRITSLLSSNSNFQSNVSVWRWWWWLSWFWLGYLA